MKIHTIRLGLDYCYLIQDGGTIMVDGGSPSQDKEFTRALGKISVKPEAIRLLVITHGHFDHIGSARDIKEITGAKLAMHEREKERVGVRSCIVNMYGFAWSLGIGVVPLT